MREEDEILEEDSDEEESRAVTESWSDKSKPPVVPVKADSLKSIQEEAELDDLQNSIERKNNSSNESKKKFIHSKSMGNVLKIGGQQSKIDLSGLS
jgi:hypothetical protein